MEHVSGTPGKQEMHPVVFRIKQYQYARFPAMGFGQGKRQISGTGFRQQY
jgi:hypothetical protein